jgi:LuxR family maltose regulon positive regulatory protein
VTSLLPTKFYLPPTSTGFVLRPQILERLDETLTHRLTLVSAPAGAGKTTAVSAWAQSAHRQGRTFGWLSLDEGDNTPERFLDYLLACLEEGGMLADTGETTTFDQALAELIRELVALRREVILILDDYHHIQNPPIHTALQYLVDHAPPSFHLVMLTRSDPPLELARLRVAGQLAEIRMEHLRFSAAEAGAFLEKSAGVSLTDSDVAALNARTEGWIAGLQMAAISLRGAADPAAFVAAFAGSHRYVFDYLIEQVLNRQTPAVREFLLKTSVLERFSAPLCDAVAGTNGAAGTLLDAMERANLFLVPLDNERGWYRYHHLFAELLKLMLDQAHPGLAAGLHRLAGQWFLAQGMLAEALHYSLAAGDMEMAARIVAENVLALVERAEIAPLLARIEAISPVQRARLPWLNVAYAWGLAYAGQNQPAVQVLSLAEQHIEAIPDEMRGKLMGHIAAVRAYLAWTHGGRSAEAISFAETAEKLLPGDEIAVRALNLTTLGNALSQTNDDLRAAEILAQALSLAQQAGQSHVAMQAASGLAYALMLMGKPRRGQVVCEEAIALAEAYQRRNARPLTAVASVYAILARIWLEFAAFEKALSFARKAVALSELWGQLDTLMMSLQYLVYALAFTDQMAAAQERIQATRKLAQQGPPWHLMGLDLIELEMHLDSDPQNVGEIKREAARKQETALKDSAILAARVLLKQNRPAEALEILECERAKFDRYGNYLKVRCHILKALAHYQQKEQAAALNAIQQALEIAGPENLTLIFLREGAAMEKLLRLAQGRAIQPGFVARLLAAIETRHRHPEEPLPPTEALIEPLSERELEVLRHLNSYLSTPEIADLLVVSANTVRTHIKNIYGKLGVHGRSGAVKRARELGLLT